MSTRPFGSALDTQAGWSAVALTVGTPGTIGRKLLVNCLTAGSAVIKLYDGSEVTLNFAVGNPVELDLAVLEIVSVTGFVGSFYNIL